MIPSPAHRLRDDARGVTVIEFAIIAPVMMIAIMGLSDMCYQLYAQSVLTGAVQKAGRDSSIQGADTTVIDQKVITLMGPLVKTPSKSCPSTTATTWCSVRKNYDTFAAVAPEPFTDNNNDGICNNGEPYTDINNNGSWDADPGTSGQGGANDVALYTMTISYPRLFPVAGLLGWSSTATISATTLLKNQPYASQTTTTPVVRNCT